jgi:transketolase C-terminal domain/subunit
MQNWHNSQRGYFAGALFDEMARDDSIWLLTGDLGYSMLDKIRDTYPDRFINCGASEQAMVGIAVGLALEGKKPFCYTITSFYLRAAETIALYLEHEQIPVRLIGSGRGDDYKDDGYSHWGGSAEYFLHHTIEDAYPQTKEDVPNLVQYLVMNNKPAFLSLRR